MFDFLKKKRPQRDLIFDIGVNHGEESACYLAKGFRVVGVEASPVLVEELRQVFAAEIRSGQLILEPVGIMNERGTLPFYNNISCDHWSSFMPDYGCRGDTQFEVLVGAILVQNTSWQNVERAIHNLR